MVNCIHTYTWKDLHTYRKDIHIKKQIYRKTYIQKKCTYGKNIHIKRHLQRNINTKRHI